MNVSSIVSRATTMASEPAPASCSVDRRRRGAAGLIAVNFRDDHRLVGPSYYP